MAALTCAFEITDAPDWQDQYDVTVYQLGWRLGGKGASGRGKDGRIEEHGPFEINGAPDMMQALDGLLRAFVEQRRMKIAGDYRPCYRVVA